MKRKPSSKTNKQKTAETFINVKGEKELSNSIEQIELDQPEEWWGKQLMMITGNGLLEQLFNLLLENSKTTISVKNKKTLHSTCTYSNIFLLRFRIEQLVSLQI